MGRFFSGQRVTVYGLYSNIISSFIHFFVSYFLAVYLDLGMLGISLASCFHFFCRFFTLLLCLKVSGRFERCLVSITDADNFKNLKGQFMLSLSAASLGVWSWWAFDIFTLIASYMSIEDLAAQTVLRNIGLLTFMIPVGLSVSAVILVGNMIGAKNIRGAVIYAKMISLSGVIWAVGSVLFINALQG